MYKSLKSWLKVPIELYPFIKRDGTGHPTFGTPIALKCYPQGKVTMVRDVTGNEIVSNLQLYLDGDVVINNSDTIMFSGTMYSIKTLGPYYDGNTGKIDLMVVYL